MYNIGKSNWNNTYGPCKAHVFFLDYQLPFKIPDLQSKHNEINIKIAFDKLL